MNLMTDGDGLIYEGKPDDWNQDMYHDMREYDDGVWYPKECGLCMMIKRKMCLANSKMKALWGL